MNKLSESFDQYIKEKMQDLDFARETLLTSIEHFDEPVAEALRDVIQKMGTNKFAEKAQLPSQEIIDFLNCGKRFDLDQINSLLKVFKLKSQFSSEDL